MKYNKKDTRTEDHLTNDLIFLNTFTEINLKWIRKNYLNFLDLENIFVETHRLQYNHFKKLFSSDFS